MEIWKDIQGFVGYQVSNRGRVRTFWHREHYPTGYGTRNVLGSTYRIMSLSDDGNGYLKVMLYSHEDGRRYCKKVHRLVAEAFMAKPFGNDWTVDHIQSGRLGKLDNSVTNLQWVSRAENIKKAYRDGMCDERIAMQRRPIIATNLWSGEELYFHSIKEASETLGIERSSISHVLIGDYERVRHYTFEYAGREERLLYGFEDY